MAIACALSGIDRPAPSLRLTLAHFEPAGAKIDLLPAEETDLGEAHSRMQSKGDGWKMTATGCCYKF